MWQLLVEPISSLIGSGVNYFKEKQVLKAAVTERKDELTKIALETKLEVIKRGDISNMQLDQDANNRIGWADDVSFGLALLPAVLAFYPPALPAITAGFVALGQMPIWYQYALGMMLVSVWGYRKLVAPIVLSLAQAYLGGKRNLPSLGQETTLPRRATQPSARLHPAMSLNAK